MFVSGREAAGIWEGEWHLVFRSGILESVSLPFASVEDVCGARLKIHWTTKWKIFLLGSSVKGWPFLAGVCCYPCCLWVVQMYCGNK